jgi:DNA-binding CsgD family transcriptional regulator
MQKRVTLRASEIRDIMRLLGEVRELGIQPELWRSHAAQGLIKLTDARVCICGEHFISRENTDQTWLVGLVDLGWEKSQAQVFYQYLADGSIAQDPLQKALIPISTRCFTRRRRDLVDDQTWYDAPATTTVRQNANVDDLIYSRWPLPLAGWGNMFLLMRSWGAAPFSPRDRIVVSLFHRELGRVWRSSAGEAADLPPRLRQTLQLAAEGLTEKKIAQKLGLSTHTVHDFFRRLYRQFSVKTRAQLLAHPLCRPIHFRPALSIFPDDRYKS